MSISMRQPGCWRRGSERKMLIAKAALLASVMAAQSTEWIPLFDGSLSTAGSKWSSAVTAKCKFRTGDPPRQGPNDRHRAHRRVSALGYEIRFEAARFEGNDFFAGIVFP
jgi:hypothetical protein